MSSKKSVSKNGSYHNSQFKYKKGGQLYQASKGYRRGPQDHYDMYFSHPEAMQLYTDPAQNPFISNNLMGKKNRLKQIAMNQNPKYGAGQYA